MTDLVGRTLGQYKILAEIGHGGMADVYRAIQTSIGREVAIKVMPAHFLQDRTFLERFTREVRVIAQLQHPRILPVYDFGEQDGMPYIVMAYMTGGTLADRIEESPGGLPLDAAAWYVGQIAEALDFAHSKGIIHRDFKPSNVLLDEANNVLLADFGIAKVTEATAQLTGSGIVGTPAYMAPEMARPGGVTPLVDVYALGVTLYQMLTGRIPFLAATPMGVLMAHAVEPIPDARQRRPDLSDSVQAIIERGMAKDPMDRYPTAGELAADLNLTAPSAAPAARRYKPLAHEPGPEDGVPQEVVALVRQGKKIEAVRALRAAKQLGLREAKDIVDEIERRHPAPATRPYKLSCLQVAVLVAAFILIIPTWLAVECLLGTHMCPPVQTLWSGEVSPPAPVVTSGAGDTFWPHLVMALVVFVVLIVGALLIGGQLGRGPAPSPRPASPARQQGRTFLAIAIGVVVTLLCCITVVVLVIVTNAGAFGP